MRVCRTNKLYDSVFVIVHVRVCALITLMTISVTNVTKLVCRDCKENDVGFEVRQNFLIGFKVCKKILPV